MKVVIYADRHPRSKHIAASLVAGAQQMGWEFEMTRDDHRLPRGDLLATYGWRNRPMMEAYKAAGAHFLYFDLGYWGRKHYQSDYGGYHKAVLDARHPTAYFMRNRPRDRITADDIAPVVLFTREYAGRHIVLAGLSGKGAESLGFEPFEWENGVISEIRKRTDRPIVYRPKPSWDKARPIHGTTYSSGRESINDVLIDAHLLVAHYSNAAIDALAAGVPIVAEEGPATVLGSSLDDIERPRYPTFVEREQFINDVSYCHFLRAEISDGTMFKQFIKDGLIVC